MSTNDSQGPSARTTLSEVDSKNLLRQYGLPLLDEKLVSTPSEAAQASREMGFPLVLKAVGPTLTHKTERGLVALDASGPEEVRKRAETMAREAGNELTGFLLAPRLPGRREFVAGMFRDKQFGPVVMLGLGGIFTEALDDVTFRLAPLGKAEAGRMLDELRSSRLLGPFRGEGPADREALIRTLTGLSRLALEREDVAEVDVNPLLVGPDGRVVAVDALVVLAPPPEEAAEVAPANARRVAAMFNPHSVAFIGASNQFNKWGHQLFSCTLAGGFGGQIHLVNPKGGEIAGRPVYKTVGDIPGEVDLVVVSIPAAHILGLLPQLAQKGVKGMVLITSGFGETGPEGKVLEDRVMSLARELDITILGPNTMGIMNPHHSFYCTGVHVFPRAGSTALVAQSGNMGMQLLDFAEEQGIGIRAFAGSGNEAMVTIEDALAAFQDDPVTKSVLLYIESVKHGRRFYEHARRVSRNKPVVVLKGGRSAAGKAAAASHTGALASDSRVFNATCRQAGLVVVEQPLELLDLSASFASLPLPKGRRVAVMTLGGGWGVVTADLLSDNGLLLPELPAHLVERFDAILPPFWSRANPVDLVGETNPQVPVDVLEALMAWDGCDAVLNLGIVGRIHMIDRLVADAKRTDPDLDPEFLDGVLALLRQFEKDYVEQTVRLMERYSKPVILVSLSSDPSQKTVRQVDGARHSAVVFPTPERAVRSLARMRSYARWREGELS